MLGATGSGTDAIARVLPRVAEAIAERVAPAVGGIGQVREEHLASAVKAELGSELRTHAVSRVLTLPEWPKLGRSSTDVVIDRPAGSGQPSLVAELKWCQSDDDKVYEAIWDLFKVALIARRYPRATAYLITAATDSIWRGAFCRDLLDDGEFAPEELCTRVLPWSRTGRIAWDDLLDGGYDRHPESVPGRIRTTRVASTLITEATGPPSQAWEVRAVKVEPLSDGDDVPFPHGWPHGARPPGARCPRPTPLA